MSAETLFTGPSALHSAPASAPGAALAKAGEFDLIEDALRIELHRGLVMSLFAPGGSEEARIMDGIKQMRARIAREFGLVVPEVRLTDVSTVPKDGYRILLHGGEVARGVLRPGRCLAIPRHGDTLDLPGERVQDPAFGLPAIWLDEDMTLVASLALAEVFTPGKVLAVHLEAVVRANLGALLTRSSVLRLAAAMTDEDRALFDRTVPADVSLSDLTAVLRALLAEGVPVRSLPLILDALSETAPWTTERTALIERARQRLASAISQMAAKHCHSDSRTIRCLRLSYEWEQMISQYGVEGQPYHYALPPTLVQALMLAIHNRRSDALEQNEDPVLVVPSALRPFVREVVVACECAHMPVIGRDEVAPGWTLDVVRWIEMPAEVARSRDAATPGAA